MGERCPCPDCDVTAGFVARQEAERADAAAQPRPFVSDSGAAVGEQTPSPGAGT